MNETLQERVNIEGEPPPIPQPRPLRRFPSPLPEIRIDSTAQPYITRLQLKNWN